MKTHRRYPPLHEPGNVLVITALLIVLLFGMTALAIDMGHVHRTFAELQAVADSAALAGASGLSISFDEARNRAVEYAQKNKANGAPVVLESGDIQLGIWNEAAHVFTPNASQSDPASAIRVTPRLARDRSSQVDLLFAAALGFHSVDMSASATAVFGSRDIVLTLDYSGSMCYDSWFSGSSNTKLSVDAIKLNLQKIWVDLGSPIYGKLGDPPITLSGSTSQVRQTLGLDKVPYPYAGSGSWDNYISYVQSDGDLNAAGYRNKYGFLTLMSYLQSYPLRSYANTPVLWKTREQPIASIKDAVSVFLAFMQASPTDDRVGLTVYTSSSGQAVLESPLTSNYSVIDSTVHHRQAGHYYDTTNIAAGIKTARTELLSHGRSSAAQVLVLLTDGLANIPSVAAGKANVLTEAHLTADARIPIVTISFGSDADKDLMQQIADITGGIHFNIPGGQSVEDYRDQLMNVFQQIAASRPLKLVN